jgi:hypothetical protein
MSSQFNAFLASSHRADLHRTAERSRGARGQEEMSGSRSATSIISAWRGKIRSVRKAWTSGSRSAQASARTSRR